MHVIAYKGKWNTIHKKMTPTKRFCEDDTMKLTKLTCVPRHLEGKVKRWKALKDIQINKTILCEQQDRLAHP